MSTHSIAQTLKDLRPLDASRLLVGIVVDNNDPDKRQRIRVQVPNLLESQNTEDLPWFAPRHISPYGIGDDFGVIRIPRVGSRVYVSFQDGDGSFGEYLADVVTSAVTPPAEMLTNYPNRIGFFTPVGDIAYLDLSTKEMMLRRASGTSIKIDADGNVTMVVAGNFTQTVKGDYNLIVEGDAGVVTKGDHTNMVSGDLGTIIQGSQTTTVSGSQTNNVSGSRTVTCSSESHVGKITNLGDVVADGVSLTGHTHGGVDTGGGNTAPPN